MRDNRISGRCLVLLLSTGALLSACSIGPRFSDSQERFVQLEAGKGRVFIYSSTSPGRGSRVYIGDKDVGSVVGGTFYFVDLPAGDYEMYVESLHAKSETALVPVEASAEHFVELIVDREGFLGGGSQCRPLTIDPKEGRRLIQDFEIDEGLLLPPPKVLQERDAGDPEEPRS